MCFASTKMLDFSLDSDRNMFKVCELGYTQLTQVCLLLKLLVF